MFAPRASRSPLAPFSTPASDSYKCKVTSSFYIRTSSSPALSPSQQLAECNFLAKAAFPQFKKKKKIFKPAARRPNFIHIVTHKQYNRNRNYLKMKEFMCNLSFSHIILCQSLVKTVASLESRNVSIKNRSVSHSLS